MNFFSSLFGATSKNNEKVNDALFKTKRSFFSKIGHFITGKQAIKEDFLELIEEALFSADINSKTVFYLLEKIEKNDYKNQDIDTIIHDLKKEIKFIFEKNSYYKNPISNQTFNHSSPFVILIVGVNGVGKTTSVAKLAQFFKNNQKSVLLGAADTFRAAASEQLNLWSKKLDIPIVKKEAGSDPSSVVFDTIQSAISKKTNIVLIDTAGRLHNKTNLMEELSKIKRVANKNIENAPHEVLLVIDGTTGQNAINQAQEFLKYTNVTGLIVTKLDGSAKGGMIISIADQLDIPIKFIGVGEGIDDLIEFNYDNYIESFFNKKELSI